MIEVWRGESTQKPNTKAEVGNLALARPLTVLYYLVFCSGNAPTALYVSSLVDYVTLNQAHPKWGIGTGRPCCTMYSVP